MPRKTGIKIFNGKGKLVALDTYQNARYKKAKGGHRLMITFPFDGFI